MTTAEQIKELRVTIGRLLPVVEGSPKSIAQVQLGIATAKLIALQDQRIAELEAEERELLRELSEANERAENARQDVHRAIQSCEKLMTSLEGGRK